MTASRSPATSRSRRSLALASQRLNSSPSYRVFSAAIRSTISSGDIVLNAELERHPLQLAQILGQFLCFNSRIVDGLQVRLNHLAELGQVCEMTLAVKQRAPKLPLQLLNRARK